MIVGIYSFRMQKTFPFLILGVLGGYGGVIRPVWTVFQLFPKWRFSLIEDLLTLDDCLITGGTFILHYFIPLLYHYFCKGASFGLLTACHHT